MSLCLNLLTHWGRVTQICVSKFTIIGSDSGLSPIRRQSIIWINAGILLIGTLGTNFSEILIQIHPFSNKKMHLKMSYGKWRPFCLGLNVLIQAEQKQHCTPDLWKGLWTYIYCPRISEFRMWVRAQIGLIQCALCDIRVLNYVKCVVEFPKGPKIMWPG